MFTLPAPSCEGSNARDPSFSLVDRSFSLALLRAGDFTRNGRPQRALIRSAVPVVVTDKQ